MFCQRLDKRNINRTNIRLFGCGSTYRQLTSILQIFEIHNMQLYLDVGKNTLYQSLRNNAVVPSTILAFLGRIAFLSQTITKADNSFLLGSLHFQSSMIKKQKHDVH